MKLPHKTLKTLEKSRAVTYCSLLNKISVHVMGRVGVGCKNIDSFSMAQYQYETFNYFLSKNKEKRVLVLNLANPVNPGGGVRNGARAQEEDLCRKSSLLFLLESHSAKRYYVYNKSLHTYLGSDTIILTPNVEIIKDAKDNRISTLFSFH